MDKLELVFNIIKKGQARNVDRMRQNDSQVGEYQEGKMLEYGILLLEIVQRNKYRNYIKAEVVYIMRKEKKQEDGWNQFKIIIRQNQLKFSYWQIIYIGSQKWKTIFEKKMIREGFYNSQGMKCGLDDKKMVNGRLFNQKCKMRLE